MNQDTSKYAHSEEAKHIIKQNEFFHEENRKLRDEIADQKNQYDTLENEVESREKQVTYMRGLLKNFIAISEKEKDLSDCKENKIKMEVKLSLLRRSNHVPAGSSSIGLADLTYHTSCFFRISMSDTKSL